MTSIKRRIQSITHKVFRSCGAKVIPCRFNGVWLKIPIDIWTGFRSSYEPYMSTAIFENLGKEDTFLDIGAHYGLWSMFAARIVGSTGSVFSFEPSPAYEQLSKSANIYSQINPIRMGLGDTHSELTFYSQGVATSGSFVEAVTLINQKFQSDVPITPQRIPVSTIDHEVSERKITPKLIKIDVEGFEARVLEGARNTLRDVDAAWIIEVHPPQLEMTGSSADEVIRKLKEAGLSVTILDRNPNSLFTVLAKRTKQSY